MSFLPRVVRRAPGYSFAIAGMLAIGSSFLLVIASQIDAVLFRPPPFPHPDRLAMVFNISQGPRSPGVRLRWSLPRIQLLREFSSDFATVGNYSPANLTLTREGEAESVSGEVASPGYFTLLGASPLLGRTFLPIEDSVPGANPVAVIGEDLWRRRFAGDSTILGSTVRVNGQSLTVIGVMGRGFRGLSGTAQIWIPTVMAPRLTYPEYLTSDQHFISAIARLRDGITLAEADARFRAIGTRIAAAQPANENDQGEQLHTAAISLNQARVSQTNRQSLRLLFAGAVLLHLLACANVINLMLGRAVSRRREAAILVAIGGSSWRRFRHFAAEGVILTVPACLAGMSIAALVVPLLRIPPEMRSSRNLYGSLNPFADPGFGWHSWLFGLGLTICTMLLVSWVPVMTLTRRGITTFLREGAGNSRRAGTLRRPSLRGLIVAGETALAMMLLVAAGLLLDSFMRLRSTPIGVNPDGVLTFWIRPSEASLPTDSAPAFVSRLLAAIGSVPGVEAATVDGGAPVSGSASSTLIIANHPPVSPTAAPPVLRHYVGPNHFKVLGVPLLRGRVFAEGDVAGGPRVAIISQSAALKFWPHRDPLGERIWFGGGSDFDSPERSAEIVGVVGDVAYQPLDAGDNRSDFYTPYQQFTYGSRVVLVRTRGDPMAAVAGIRRAVHEVDPDLPLLEVRTLHGLIADSWAHQRFDAIVFAAFGAVGLLLSAAGVFSVVSFAVRARTQEMGIRLALGAQPWAILRLVVGEGLVFPGIGLVIGVVGSVAVTRLLRSSLYQVAPGDPKVPLATLGLLLAVAAWACYVPARRATTIDPASILRAD